MKLKKTLKKYIDTIYLGSKSNNQLRADLMAVRNWSRNVLICSIFLIGIIFFISLYILYKYNDINNAIKIMVADGIIISLIADLARRSYSDYNGASYLLSISNAVSTSQMVEIIRSVLKEHFNEKE